MKKIVPKIFSFLGILVIFTLITGCSKNATQKSSKVTTQSTPKQESKHVTKVLTSKKFSNLKIISQNIDIVLETGKSYKVTYQGKNTTIPIVKQGKSKLTVNQVKAQHSLGLMRLPMIIITVPKKAKLNKVTINNGSADVRINNLNLKRGVISTDSGDIIISNSKSVNGMNLKSTTGSIKVRNTKFTGYKLTTNDGQIQVKDEASATSYTKNAKSKNVLVAKSGSKEIWVN
ncbi:DUF4097 family beta strand repeat-containing protein [Lactobacillus sp.]|uniref:DUF4097 family beta strand repeat-containing protein n=1 Tax=Lactobacillus sp. TaxID=1591 RepID=UPI0019AF9DD5|nr:DUF4097 family beta strand repeat-containing protein [Lactobacillus sp.]MBD5430304.1 DUF4097 domain-containing protein [Lactobacillus sp.]